MQTAVEATEAGALRARPGQTQLDATDGGKLGKNNLFARQCSPRGGELKLELTPDCLLVQGEAVVVLEGFVTV